MIYRLKIIYTKAKVCSAGKQIELLFEMAVENNVWKCKMVKILLEIWISIA